MYMEAQSEKNGRHHWPGAGTGTGSGTGTGWLAVQWEVGLASGAGN